MLSPSCEGCGCALEARVMAAPVIAAPGLALPPVAVVALRRIGVLLCALMLYAAAKVGFNVAGASGALIAFGVGGFLLLPFVPERIA